jgi:cytidylate kinase
MHAPVIAVDGPAGSGKSSVCRGVASVLGLRYLDTGAMYRAVTWAVLEANLDPHDGPAVAELATSVVLTSGTDPAAPTIHVGDVDVTLAVRGDAVTAAVSAVSAVAVVREHLVALQRETVQAAHRDGLGIVVEGRDITTVVLPDADLKLFVTADPAVRAARRAAQDAEREGEQVDVETTEAQLRTRDAKDSSREASPLAQAPDAVVVDTSNATLDESIAQVADLVMALPDPS